MTTIAVLVLGVGAATALSLTAFRKNLMYFYTPSDLVAGRAPGDAVLDLGGLVEKGSLRREHGLAIDFIVTDCRHSVPVRYDGILPDLFREGQGVVATGHWQNNQTFVADRILAKHDANYMPPNVAAALKSADADGRRACQPFKAVSGDAPAPKA
jgi:cytochrome c-type biogenesis protein CcmE